MKITIKQLKSLIKEELNRSSSKKRSSTNLNEAFQRPTRKELTLWSEGIYDESITADESIMEVCDGCSQEVKTTTLKEVGGSYLCESCITKARD